MTAPFEVVPAAPLVPDRLRTLAAEASGAGIRNISTLVDGWADRSERSDEPGEGIFAALADGEMIGVGGLTHCRDVAGAMRVRRLYIATAWRRRGVARAPVERHVELGFRSTETLTCNAGASDAAAPFWEALGFEPVVTPGITHVHRP